MPGERRQRRSQFDIWEAILRFLASEDATRSKLVAISGLNWYRLTTHLQAMMAEGLVQCSSSEFEIYSITEDGVKWLKRYEGLRRKRDKDRQLG
jgi:predicted transcriptional regulator